MHRWHPAKPSVLHVRNFTVPGGVEFDVAAPPDSGSIEDRVAGFVADGITSNAEKWVAPPSKLANRAAIPANGLLVEGKFTRVRQGSRGLRLVVGFGAGRSRMDTTVRVYNLEKSAEDPWLIFKTSGGSNVEPGLVGAVVPGPLTVPAMAAMAGGVASTVVSRGMTGVSNDGRRTGKVIAAAVHDYLVKHGVVERKARVKRGGKVSTPAGELAVPGRCRSLRTWRRAAPHRRFRALRGRGWNGPGAIDHVEHRRQVAKATKRPEKWCSQSP